MRQRLQEWLADFARAEPEKLVEASWISRGIAPFPSVKWS
jgi:hypothetical protein